MPSEHYLTLMMSLLKKNLDEWRQTLLGLTILGRHSNNYLWLFKQPYSSISNNLRGQAKAIFIWYPKEKVDIKMMHDEDNLQTTD